MENNRLQKQIEKAIPIAALVIGAIVLIAILIHAKNVLTGSAKAGDPASEEGAGTAVQQEAEGQMWVEESELETNEDITLSLTNAVLGTTVQKKDLVVFEQKISDITRVEDEGKLPFNLSRKYQYVKYSGTATYTVDLSGIDSEHLYVNEAAKTLTIYIPHAVEKLDINEDETQADETQNVGIFSIGDLKLTEEERSEVIDRVKKEMQQDLADEKVIEIADRMAKLSVWEIYQPVVTKVSPEYTVVTEFI